MRIDGKTAVVTGGASGTSHPLELAGLKTVLNDSLRGIAMKLVGGVKSVGSDPNLIEIRRGQIIRTAVKLFSENGYYHTTTQQIAREAGISAGLIYHYFHDKDDILFMALRKVLDTYEQEIPAALTDIEHPVDRLCMAIFAYCRVSDRLRKATVLTYRSTKSLRAERRVVIKEGETRTNRLMETYVAACIDGDFLRPVNAHMLVYVMVMFAHTWALKNWALRERYTLRQYVGEGLKLLIEPHLTTSGRIAFHRFKIHLSTFAVPPEVNADTDSKLRRKASASTAKSGRRRRARAAVE
jgi:AcrR family transcriptional regulator